MQKKVQLTRCVLCGADMTLDAAWLHMARLNVRVCVCVLVAHNQQLAVFII